MSYILDKVSIDSFYGNILLGVFEILKKNHRVKDVQLQRKEPLKFNCVTYWEATNGCELPKDLKNFYLSTNGFSFTWKYRFGPEVLPVGAISICSFENLILLTGYRTVQQARIKELYNRYSLELSEESKVSRHESSYLFILLSVQILLGTFP